MDFIRENLIWFAMAIVSGGMLLWPMVRGRAGGTGVGPAQATMLINREDAVVLDVRDQGEFVAGHILNARHIPLGQLEKRLPEIEKHKDKPVVICCASGNRSASAGSILRKAGFENVRLLTGGINAWQDAGLPTTKK